MTRRAITALALTAAAALAPSLFAAPAAGAGRGGIEERCEDADGQRLPPSLERRCEHLERIEEHREEQRGGGDGGSDRPAREQQGKGGARDRRAGAKKRGAKKRGAKKRGAKGGKGRRGRRGASGKRPSRGGKGGRGGRGGR